MKLTPKKIRYSNKQGVSIEWQHPDEIVISSEDLLMLLLGLKGYLTQEEMDQHFSQTNKRLSKNIACKSSGNKGKWCRHTLRKFP